MHGSARLTVHQRQLICSRVLDEDWTVADAAEAVGVSRQTASKWLRRFRTEGSSGLSDRSTRPHHSPTRVREAVVRRIVKARLRLRCGPHVLSWMLGYARSTIYVVLRRLGLNKLSRLEPRPEIRRYEWPACGDMIHFDTKKLGRIDGVGKRFGGPKRSRTLGWNAVHIAIDDHSRLAYAEELKDEFGQTAAGFAQRAFAFFGAHGITPKRVLTDNGSPYRSKSFAAAMQAHSVRHRFTRPYTPRTNGKAEAMVKILINGWAYRRPYKSSAERRRALDRFMWNYNHRRPHGGLNGARPIDRVGQ